MKTSLRGLAEIASHEGIVLSPYRDSVGVWTWGVGHTKAAGDPNPKDMDRGVNRPLREVFDVFARDIAKYEREVNDAITVPVSQSEFDALVSFHYNTGGIARAQLTGHLNEGRRSEAARAFDGWHRPPEIIPRRNKEKALFANGIYSGGGMATVYPADEKGRVQWGRGERINVLSILDPRPDDPGPEPEPPLEWPEKPAESGNGKAADIGVAGSIVAVGAFLWDVSAWIGIACIVALVGFLAIRLKVWKWFRR